MPRVSYKYNLSDEDKAIAKSNGIPIPTLYHRLRGGWDKKRAISEPPQKNKSTKLKRDENGEIQSQINGGKVRTFVLPEDLDAKFDKIVEKSGLSVSAYVRKLVSEHLKRKKS